MSKVDYEYTDYTTNQAMNIMLTAERDVCECLKKYSHKDVVNITEVAFNIGVIMSRARSDLFILLRTEENKSYEAKETKKAVEITKLNSTLLDIKNSIPYVTESLTWNYSNEMCKHCGNNPKNGGSGICHCTLAAYKIT